MNKEPLIFTDNGIYQSFMTHGKEEFLQHSVLQEKAVNKLGFIKEFVIAGIKS